MPLLRILLLLACLAPLSLPVLADGKTLPIRMIASIKPLQLIAAAITDGLSKPDVLLDPGLSPHSYSMKPSDIRRLTDVSVIFWLGPELEKFLEKPLEQLPKKRNGQQRIIALMSAPDIQLREWDGESHHHDPHEHRHHGNIDSHIWLSPRNAIAMGKEIANTLSLADSGNASRYRNNLATFIEQVTAADLANDKDLAVVRQQGFFVFHDAWGYLADHYGLTVKGVFALSPDRQPGARHLMKLKNTLRLAGHTCIFREPQFKPAYIDRLTEGLNIGEAVLDPMAGDIPVFADGYPQFLRHLGRTIARCLTE
ncbi:MAG: zinc ABC transporter substrate-binding protein [Endozoicomonadaceae bacterium]|nr:zinc ABC transporter substrate-binding protein [Endozoicomonadaceae bacterium]